MKKTLTTLFSVATIGMFAQDLKVDPQATTIKWHGKKVTGEHFGTIQLTEGRFVVEESRIVTGEFLVDMTSIKNTDVKDDGYRQKLENHLKSDDFFGVEKFPVARLEIVDSETLAENKLSVKGNLTIKDITHPIEFITVVDGNTFTADLVIDRSKYNVRYGSGSFFDNLGDKTIYDDFKLTVNLVTYPDEEDTM